jgi:phage terminase large subunit
MSPDETQFLVHGDGGPVTVTKTYEIPYAPRRAFKAFHETNKRWSCIVAHRRAGKTVAAVNKLIKSAAECKHEHPRFGYVAPFLSQAKEIAWAYLKRYSEPMWAGEPNESELRVTLFNGADIRLHGSDNPDRLRGPYFDGVVMDEFANQRSAVWGEVVRPMLADRIGWAAFIGTPKGHNAFYKVWRSAANNPHWFRAIVKASTSGILPLEELDDMQEDMSPEEYEQEMECSFESAIKGAFYADQLRRMDAEGRICHIDIDRAVRVHTAWDLGRRDATAIWFIQCVGRERRLVDYYEASGADIPHYASVLQDKRRDRGWIYGDHYFPHDVAVHMLDSKLSRVETFAAAGIEATYPKQAFNKMDGINAVRRMLDRSWIDPDFCNEGLEALRNYKREWNDKLKDFMTNPQHDWASHGADALAQFACQYDDPKSLRDDGAHRRRMRANPTKPSAWSV